MYVKIDAPYSFEDAMEELGKVRTKPQSDVFILNVEDKFFVGGGCEAYHPYPDDPHPNYPYNVSICMESPLN